MGTGTSYYGSYYGYAPNQATVNPIRPQMGYPPQQPQQQLAYYPQPNPYRQMNPYQQNPYQPPMPLQYGPQSQYGLSDFETSIIQNYFGMISGIDQRLDRQEFTVLIAKLYPHVAGHQLQMLADGAFRSIDINGDGYISLDEFVAAYRNFKNQNVSNFF